MRFSADKEPKPFFSLGHWLVYWIIVIAGVLPCYYYYDKSRLASTGIWLIIVGVVFGIILMINQFAFSKKKADARRREAYRKSKADKQAGETETDDLNESSGEYSDE